MAENGKHKIEYMMSRIIEVRYTDLEEEKKLCKELLVWSTENKDCFARAFALTYLGDYYLAFCDAENAGKYILEVEGLLTEEECWNTLKLRLFGLLGLYHDLRGDEQNAIEYYLRAIAWAKKILDNEGECVASHNLAFVFQRHHCYEEARNFYLKSYYLQEKLEECGFRPVLISNLVEVYLMLDDYDEAKRYIEICDNIKEESNLKKALNYKNWCSYYATKGESQKAYKYAQLLLFYQESINENPLTAFEVYHTLCEKMMDVGNGKQAKVFLKIMDKMGFDVGLDRVKLLEESRIRYALLFEKKESHEKAYQRFYNQNQAFREKVVGTVVEAMKSSMYLEEIHQQTELLQSEQETLEEEVKRDALTGIYNRKFMEEMMRTFDADESIEVMGLIIFDIDYFKEYNDYYGHIQGDIVLKDIANCLNAKEQTGIYPCRYGGDEFVTICQNMSHNQVETYIKTVRERLHQMALPHAKSYCSNEVTLSIGYVVCEEKIHTEMHLLFQLADQALYKSKRAGRNTYTRNSVDD